jgi:putative transposase
MIFHSNIHWCSGGFEIKYYSGEKIYVAFVLDCSNRVAICPKPLVTEDMRSLMIDPFKKRFKDQKAIS